LGPVRRYFAILELARGSFVEHRCRDTAATMALHLTMGLMAMSLVITWVGGVTGVGVEVVRTFVFDVIGDNAGGVFDSLMQGASTHWRSSLPVVGALLVLLWNSVSVLRRVQTTVNDVVGVRIAVDRRHRLVVALKRAAGALFVGGAASGLLVSFSAKTALELLDALGIGPVASAPWLFRAVEVVVALIVATLLFACIFRLLPDAKLRFRGIWHGAFWAAKLYAVVQIVAAFAIVYVGGMSHYGEAAVLLVLIGYLYFGSVAFLMGSEVLRIDLQRGGTKPAPSPWARRVDEHVAGTTRPLDGR
jgi:membrane protein